MLRTLITCALLGILFAPQAATAAATPTDIDVRVLSKGAKFIGTSMGGVEITLRDAATGELLAKGVTEGTTGDTGKIMLEHQPRHEPVSTEDAAVYRATLELDEPRRIEVTARGPLGQLQAAATATVTQWIVPGKPVTGGDGLVLEMPGFAVAVLDPPAHRVVSAAGEPLEVRANVVLMCGCPVEPGGLWDADGYEVMAIVKRDGARAAEVPLAYAGEPSQFAAGIEVREPGLYEITVYAYDPANGNTGLDRTTVIVR